jgi:hypothetical protein
VFVVFAAPPLAKPWSETVALRTYARAAVEKSYLGGPMLPEASVERGSDGYRWLKDEPHYMRGGAGIEFAVLGGKVTRLPFREGATEETLVNERETPREPEPEAKPEPLRPIELHETQGSPYANVQPAPKREAPEPRPEPTHTLTVPNPRGGYMQVPVQAAPTITAPPGEITACRNEGEGCGTNADCCGGNCSGGTCR